jgi:hypothetical protein
MKLLFLGATFALIALPAMAADIDCGTADLIKSQKLKLEACVDPAVWEAGQGTGDQEFIYFTRDGKAGFAVVTEQAGSNDLKAYRDASLLRAPRLRGPTAPLTSFGDASSTLNGRQWGSMRYNVKVQEDSFEFLNYYYSAEGFGSAQFIFWSLPADAAGVANDLAGKVMPTVTLQQ